MTVYTKRAYKYIIEQNTVGLNSCNFNPRLLFERVKKNADALEFLINYIICEMDYPDQ
jgi:hypothetical protein